MSQKLTAIKFSKIKNIIFSILFFFFKVSTSLSKSRRSAFEEIVLIKLALLFYEKS